MKYYSERSGTYKKHPLRRWLLLLALLVIGGLVYWFVISGDRPDTPEQNPQEEAPPAQAEEPPYQPADLQPIITDWAARQSASYSIVVYDAQSKTVIGSHDAERELFAASLYKLYVAYLSLMDFEAGAQDPDEILIAGQTRRACVDKMIRESDSPCGEAMMADIGQTVLNQRVAELGMTGTFFNGIRTTAADSAQLLRFIIEEQHLNEENTEFLRDAMRFQDTKWRHGLAAGAPEAMWDTKVGWNLDINYHDVGIMTLPDGRQFAIAILGQGSGQAGPIADFARTVYTALTEQ